MSGNKEVTVAETDDFALDLHFKEQTKRLTLFERLFARCRKTLYTASARRK